MMPINERAEAIGRARALKALGEHPRSSKRQLGATQEQLNNCSRLSAG